MEQLAEIGRLEDFMDAVDADDEARARSLMRRANLDARTIALVLRKMKNP